MWTFSHSHTLPRMCVCVCVRVLLMARILNVMWSTARTVTNLRGRRAPSIEPTPMKFYSMINRLYMYPNLNLNGNGVDKKSINHTHARARDRVYNAYHLGRVHWLGKEHGWRNSIKRTNERKPKRSFHCTRFEATAAATQCVLWLWLYSAAGVINVRYSFLLIVLSTYVKTILSFFLCLLWSVHLFDETTNRSQELKLLE